MPKVGEARVDSAADRGRTGSKVHQNRGMNPSIESSIKEFRDLVEAAVESYPGRTTPELVQILIATEQPKRPRWHALRSRELLSLRVALLLRDLFRRGTVNMILEGQPGRMVHTYWPSH